MLTPEENACVAALVALIGDATDILRPPVMVTELLVALQIHLVLNHVVFLQFREGRTQVRLFKVQLDTW